MCEFKIIDQSSGSQIGEDILILSYTEENELIYRDVLGFGEKLKSALIMDVNTVSQKCTVLQHPLIKDFLSIIRNLSANNLEKSEIENFQEKINALKGSI
jgi:predicted RNA-binding protein